MRDPAGDASGALALLGSVDIGLLDQFQRGRWRTPGRLLDAGCGSGRNLDLFLRLGHEVWVLDESPTAVESARAHAAGLGFPLAEERCLVGGLEGAPLPDGAFDTVVCIAVLHFARDRVRWNAMLDALWRRLVPGGVLFLRLATTIGVEDHVKPLGGGRYLMGDGTERYLASLDDLLEATASRGGRLLDPVKTTNVQNLRAMTTWVVEAGS